jgi:hypothetical protein
LFRISSSFTQLACSFFLVERILERSIEVCKGSSASTSSSKEGRKEGGEKGRKEEGEFDFYLMF